MKKATLLAAAMLFISSSGYGYAQTKDSAGPPEGASEFSPGDRMREAVDQPKVSEVRRNIHRAIA
jgi:hypothetical protein